jgi:hypothetical protein
VQDAQRRRLSTASARRSAPPRALWAKYIFDLFAGVLQVSAALSIFAFGLEPSVSAESTDDLLGLAPELLPFVPGLV